MEIVHVLINDVYSQAEFNIQTAALTAEAIKDALEKHYPAFSYKLERAGGGIIRVWNSKGIEVAHGSITWWFFGGHSIRIETYTQP